MTVDDGVAVVGHVRYQPCGMRTASHEPADSCRNNKAACRMPWAGRRVLGWTDGVCNSQPPGLTCQPTYVTTD